MKNIKVSIQIPTYNQQRFIKNTIESCLMQDYPNLEINVADDCSTDGTRDIVQQFLTDKRVRYFCNEVNIGRVANYGKALYEYATGDWVLNLDGDDYLTDEHFISDAVNAIQSLPEQNIVVYQANQHLEKIKSIIPVYRPVDGEAIVLSGSEYFINYFKILHFYHCATLYKRSEAITLDFYSFDCLFTDFNSIAKLFLKGELIFSGKRVAHWSQHQENESSTLNEKNINKELLAVDELGDFAMQYLPAKAVKKWRRKMRNFFIYLYQANRLKKRKGKHVMKLLLKNKDFSILYFRQCLKAILNISR